MPGIHPSMVNKMLMRTSRSHAFLLMNTASGGRNIATMIIPISFTFLFSYFLFFIVIIIRNGGRNKGKMM
jgi:hypothetical protein